MGWSDFYSDKSRTYGWPSELVISFVRGTTFPDIASRRRALEVGFGNGNNLRFLAGCGFKLAGTEVDESICAAAIQRFNSEGISADLRVGTNSGLPFEGEQFDFLLSWNVLHYEQSSADLIRGISEYARVLVPGARVLISTTAPDSPILEGADPCGDGAVIIRREDDFRKGTRFRCFRDEQEILSLFAPYFTELVVGRTTTRFAGYGQDSYLISALKR
jgi:SAM-dependent methyltransferase